MITCSLLWAALAVVAPLALMAQAAVINDQESHLVHALLLLTPPMTQHQGATPAVLPLLAGHAVHTTRGHALTNDQGFAQVLCSIKRAPQLV